MSSSDFDTLHYTLIINNSNLVSGNPNKNVFEYQFSTTKKLDKAKIALTSVSMFNSFFNISPDFDNNTFSYIWPVGPTTVNITIPEGHYSIPALNAYLQSIMIQNDHYLIDGSGNFIYYLEIVSNSTFYSIQFNSYPIPTALPSGWSAPGSWPGYPATASTPQIVISANGFSTFTGINPGTYPPAVQATNYSKISDNTPRVNYTENILVRCNLVSNPISATSDILYSFSQSGVQYGALIQSNPSEYNYLNATAGYFDRIQLRFVDQQFRDVKLVDPNIIVQLSIIEKVE